MTDTPRTEAGRALLERSRGAADAFTRTLTEAGIDYYDVKQWAASNEEILAIEEQAANIALEGAMALLNVEGNKR